MPILFSGLSGDLRQASMITLDLNLQLRDANSLRNSGYMTYIGSINNSGTDTLRARLIGLGGRDRFKAAGTESSLETETALSDGHADCGVSRYTMIRTYSDLARMTAYGSSPYEIDPFNLAQDMSASYESTFMDVTADAAEAFTNVTATTGTAMSVSTFFKGIYKLEQADSNRGVPGALYAALHPSALVELQGSLRTEQNNIVSQMVATEAMISAKGSFYCGQLFGVDVYKSSWIDNDGVDYASWMADKGALCFGDGVPQLAGAVEVMNYDKCVVELSREPAKALTSVTGHAYLGIAILNDARGVLLKSGI